MSGRCLDLRSAARGGRRPPTAPGRRSPYRDDSGVPSPGAAVPTATQSNSRPTRGRNQRRGAATANPPATGRIH